MFPWKSVIHVDKNSPKPLYLQIADAFIREIHSGHLVPGQKIPGARVFGNLLKLNRKTIVAAMGELYSQGWIEIVGQKGTFISAKLPDLKFKSLRGKAPVAVGEFKRKINPLPTLDTLNLNFGGKILIDDGVPDVRLAPTRQLLSYQRSLASKKTFFSLLKYNPVEGDVELRTTLTVYLQNTRGITTSATNVFITRGSQMGIYLAAAALVKEEDFCAVTFPGYPIVENIIPYLGGKVERVPVDEEGILTHEVEKLCKRRKIRFLYITPHHHYPTTVTLSPTRRVELLQLAVRYNFYIVEDDYDYDFHYDNNPVLPLASFNKTGHVIYIGSFSKCLSPSVRLGYLVASPAVIEAVHKLRRIIDRQGDPLAERAMSEFIKSGDLQRHLKKVLKIYRLRRDFFCSLLQNQLGDHISLVKPEGGMAVWMVFRKKISKAFLKRLSDKGYLLDSDPTFIKRFGAVRIGFASMDEKSMEKFAYALKHAMN